MSNEIIVLKIIDDYTVVINVGSDHGIKKNQQFLVYSIDPDPITDPRTNEVLGDLEIVKGRGRAKHVQPRFTTIESNEFEINRKKIAKKPKRNLYGLDFNFYDTEETYEDKDCLPFVNVEVGDFVKIL